MADRIGPQSDPQAVFEGIVDILKMMNEVLIVAGVIDLEMSLTNLGRLIEAQSKDSRPDRKVIASMLRERIAKADESRRPDSHLN